MNGGSTDPATGTSVAGGAAIVYSPALASAVLRPDHPLKPVRARLCYELLQRSGVLDDPGVRVVPPLPATEEDVLRVHTRGYVDVVRRLSEPQPNVSGWEAGNYGFSAQGDNPPFAGMYDYYLLVCGAAIEAVRLVDEGEARFAFMPAGGVNHHAMPSHASGFGVFNDAAVAIAWLRARGRRVMYVDLDVHHGDGVEAMFASDPDTLTVSLHESTSYLFPGPKGGAPENTGEEGAYGSSVNLALLPYTGDETWLWAFEQIVPPLYQAFQPDTLLVQLGADGYFDDPLAHLRLSARAYAEAARRLHQITGGRLAAVGGGGYDVDATIHIWAMEFLMLAGKTVPPEIVLRESPPPLDARTEERTRQFAEQSVATIRRLVFPGYGLR